jgi:predicted RNA binding protein YcfA (HicA-like mRNA interferase family)
MSSRELIKLLESAGYELARVKGSHHQYRHPDPGRPPVTVPHPSKDLKSGTLARILKDAGLK